MSKITKKVNNTYSKIRKSFSKLPEVYEMPDLIKIQKDSFDGFVNPIKGNISGVEECVRDIFPIKDFSGNSEIQFVSCRVEEPTLDLADIKDMSGTYSASLYVKVRLVIFEKEDGKSSGNIANVKEEEVFLGEIPVMTDSGTFVVNGTERVVVSQMHRSPGIFFESDDGKKYEVGKVLYNAKIIPYRGSWIDFEFDVKDLLFVRIDKRRKMPATTFIRLLHDRETQKRIQNLKDGEVLEKPTFYDSEKIIKEFYSITEFKVGSNKFEVKFDFDKIIGFNMPYDLLNKDGEVVVSKGLKVTKRLVGKIKDSKLFVNYEGLNGQYLAFDVINENTGEVLFEIGDLITADTVNVLNENGVKAISVVDVVVGKRSAWLLNTLIADKNKTRMDSLTDLHKVLRPGEPVTENAAVKLLEDICFSKEKYDLSNVGRVKLNHRLGFDSDVVTDDVTTLRSEDIIEVVRLLLDIKEGNGIVDDIDNLSNRRIRSVGELMKIQYRIGLLRMEKSAREKMSSTDIDKYMPRDILNGKAVTTALKDFFASSQLSQFMDQTNPLSEITHKRRLSALGPGGLARDRAGFEVRDVHTTHYGRVCPIETPEGPNIGLINSLATYANVNKYGFIETIYRKVIDGKVTDDVVYLSATEEGNYIIAQANAPLTENGEFEESLISCRCAGEYILAKNDAIDFMDVSPKQVVSVAASMIPFLENDDANRALMGANMQRQAVPLLRSEAPLVGTGIELKVAHDSGASVNSMTDGVVTHASADMIVVSNDANQDEIGVHMYKLSKHERSNQNSCINQRQIVSVGDKVKAGDIIADGPSTDKGEIALGRNLLVAFMPWNGYNFEDSILISQRIVKDDVFTSIHIEEKIVEARDTKLGEEEITRDIPNVSAEDLQNLDESGIIYVGTKVKAGDILVGRVTPKGETPVSPEEKLLRAIFGEKSSNMKDTSLRVDASGKGVVVDVKVYSRRGVAKDQRSLSIEKSKIEQLEFYKKVEIEIIEKALKARLIEKISSSSIVSSSVDLSDNSADNLEKLSIKDLTSIVVSDDGINESIEKFKTQYNSRIKRIDEKFNDKIERIQVGDDLTPGVMKVIKVYIAQKRKLQPGDKMAGRHGNKGVVSKILPEEDMPFLKDGRVVDIVLNPLGVPSRMNVGQILETHLGWASANLGLQVQRALDTYYKDNNIDGLKSTLVDVYDDKDIEKEINECTDKKVEALANNIKHGVPMATSVFDGASLEDINKELERAGVDISGQSELYDGRTGDKFERKITVGYVYMLKLNHLVDDKLHARSIGPYSLVTQQPLGGKAQFGGQRFGEMEVWALEAYGAAHILQEMLTVKSDDVSGRSKIYESIVSGSDNYKPGIPESFNVLVKEIRSLGLNIEMKQK